MTLTYYDIMNTSLSSLTDAWHAWRKMGDKFGDLQGEYASHVQGLSNGSWQGAAYELFGSASDNSYREFGAARTEAHAVASILEDAHEGLTAWKKALKAYVGELRDKGYTVSDHGKVSYTVDAEEKRSLVQSGDWQEIMERVEKADSEIKKAVKNINAFDEGIQLALVAAVTEKKDKGAPGGFNGDAKDWVPKSAGHKGGGKDGGDGKDGGWKADGSMDLTGPDADASASGVGYGMQGMAKAYVDLAHFTAEGSVSNGDVKLSGLVDVYGGARGSASYGMTDQGVWGEAEVSAGSRAMVEGRIESGHLGAYGRGSRFGGAEAAANVAVGRDQTGLGLKAFAGEKQTVAVGAEAGGIGIGGTAETWEGEGAEGFIGWKKDDNGAWHFKGKLGFTPIVPVGGAAGVEVTVDPGKVADTAKDVAGSVAHGFGKLKNVF